jgi:hypothetical protein
MMTHKPDCTKKRVLSQSCPYIHLSTHYQLATDSWHKARKEHIVATALHRRYDKETFNKREGEPLDPCPKHATPVSSHHVNAGGSPQAGVFDE